MPLKLIRYNVVFLFNVTYKQISQLHYQQVIIIISLLKSKKHTNRNISNNIHFKVNTNV